MPLPTEIKQPPTSLSAYNLLFCGEKKTGKTSLATQFPNHFMFEFEPGNAKHIACVYEDIPDLKTFEYWLKQAEKDLSGVKTIIVDGINVLYEMIKKKLCDDNEWIDLSDVGYGRGWGAAANQFNSYMQRLQGLQCGHIYTCHCEEKTAKTRTQAEVTKVVPILAKETKRFVDAKIHMSGMICFSKQSERELLIQGTDYIDASLASSGLLKTHFRWNGESLKSIPLGDSPEEGYQNLIRAFKNELNPEDPQQKGGKTEVTNNSGQDNNSKRKVKTRYAKGNALS